MLKDLKKFNLKTSEKTLVRFLRWSHLFLSIYAILLAILIIVGNMPRYLPFDVFNVVILGFFIPAQIYLKGKCPLTVYEYNYLKKRYKSMVSRPFLDTFSKDYLGVDLGKRTWSILSAVVLGIGAVYYISFLF